MIYLDNAATTPVDPLVISEMNKYFSGELFGNPGSVYGLGKRAAEAVSKAREQVASLLHTTQDHIIFTSGGSESNSLGICGAVEWLLSQGKTHIILSETEHESAYKASQSLIKLGFHISYVFPDECGVIRAAEVSKLITENTGMVVVMHTNNETGSVNEVEEIGLLCAKNGIQFHCDCVQAAGFYDINLTKLIGVTSCSISSHKINGPKGVGALYIREVEKYTPIVFGGSSQEFSLRGGTENVPGIVGFGYACEIAEQKIKEYQIDITALKQCFYLELSKTCSEHSQIIHVNGESPAKPGKILNVRFDGIHAETMLLVLDNRGIAASAGSACHAKDSRKSRVLLAMGLSDAETEGSVRFSFSHLNTKEDILTAAKEVACAATAIKSCFL